MGECVEATGLLNCLPGKINIYTSHYLCLYEVWGQSRSRASCHATEIILAHMPEEESVGPSTELSLEIKRSLWLPGRTAGRLAKSPASLSLTQSCGCTQWKQLIPLFYGEEGGGGLRSNNRPLSLEMSAVTPGDSPTGQRHFHKKPRYKMSVENNMKLCEEGNEMP